MSDTHSEVDTLEKGNIYFFYRPRVEEREPSGKSDIQQFYMVLNPERPKSRYRLLIIGREKMPNPEKAGKEREWGFVDMVRNDSKSIQKTLGEITYSTKTRGERFQPAARPCGEGIYRILRHNDHTHLVYMLELPKKEGDVQADLSIREEASYIISIKNPEKGSRHATGLEESKKADFPKYLQDRFRDRRFGELEPTDFLNYEGAEFMLIGASDDIQEELGVELKTDQESEHTADIFKKMALDKSRQPVEPLLKGEWA